MIPKNKDFPLDAVQCNKCGGNGCKECNDNGWLTPKNHPNGRRCNNPNCHTPLSPSNVAVYCSNQCALEDA